VEVIDRIRARVYDAAIVGMTAAWYRAVLTRLPTGCRLLDVGIGTGSALLANADLLVSRQLRVTGIDIDRAYASACAREVARRGLDGHVETRVESVYAHRGGPYDAAYWSGSFMLLPDPPGALRHVATLLAPGGRMYFTQTFEHQPSRALEMLKPLLRMVTTIDFGRVTYEAAFRAALTDGGVVLEALEVLDAGPRRSAMLVLARPTAVGA
jgi:SAM-dependent methyltransferase